MISIIKFLSFKFTLAICTILNGYTQVNIKILLIQSYHTTCVSFSCEFSMSINQYLCLTITCLSCIGSKLINNRQTFLFSSTVMYDLCNYLAVVLDLNYNQRLI